MSRSGYSDDCEHLELYRANVDRTIAGKKGQKFLKDLLQALDDMPNKRLIAGELEKLGEVCAIGVVGLNRGVNMENLDPNEPETVARAFGISTMLAQEIVYQNDEWFDQETPEERWVQMRKWVESNLKIK